MTKHIVLTLMGLLALKLFAAAPPEYESLKAEAEKFYADGSYAKAHELYARAMEMSNITSNQCHSPR